MKTANVNRILADTPRIYDRIADDFSDTRGQWWRGFGDFNKYVKAGDRVLDIGCGNGRMAEIFAESKIEYLGIDNSEELIKIAAERFKDRPWAKFAVGDALELFPPLFKGRLGGVMEGDSKTSPWPLLEKEGKFNLVLMIAVLHHLPTKDLRLEVLKNINAALKPGGRLIISNWNLWQVIGWKKKFRYWRYLFDYQEKIKRGAWRLSDAFVPWKPAGTETRRFIHSFGKQEMKRLLKRAGFAIEKIDFEIKGGVRSGKMRGDNLLAVAVKK